MPAQPPPVQQPTTLPQPLLADGTRKWPKLLWAGVAVMVGFLALSGFLFERWMQREKVEFTETSGAELDLIRSSIGIYLQNAINDAVSLSSYSAAWRALEDPSEDHLEAVTELYQVISENHDAYHQLRLFTLQGEEFIRVNTGGKVVPKQDLQNKQDRYYFEEAASLGAEDLFVSRLDLNVEEGEVEVPHIPVIRVMAPVFSDQGKRVGYFGLNVYFGLLEQEVSTLEQGNRLTFSVLNTDGYRMVGGPPETRWGFMFPEREPFTLRLENPEVWEQISNKEEGTLFGQEWISWRTLNLSELEFPRDATLQESSWIVMSTLSKTRVNGIVAQGWFVFLGSNVLMGLIVFFVLLSRHLKQQAIQSQLEASRFCKWVMDTAEVAILMIDPEGWICHTNTTAEKLTGFSQEELLQQMSPRRFFRSWQLLKAGVADKEVKPKGTTLFQSIYRNESLRRAEWSFLSRSGKEIPVYMTLSRIDSPKGVFYVAAITDVTPLRDVEEKLKQADKEKQSALSDIQQLKRILPICSYCKKIRDEEGAWNQLESYISHHSDIGFSHGICQACMEKNFGDLDLGKDSGKESS